MGGVCCSRSSVARARARLLVRRGRRIVHLATHRAFIVLGIQRLRYRRRIWGDVQAVTMIQADTSQIITVRSRDDREWPSLQFVALGIAVKTKPVRIPFAKVTQGRELIDFDRNGGIIAAFQHLDGESALH